MVLVRILMIDDSDSINYNYSAGTIIIILLFK
jgi:hypothetical protein